MAKQKKLNGKGTVEEVAAPVVSEAVGKKSVSKKPAAKKAAPKKQELEAQPTEKRSPKKQEPEAQRAEKPAKPSKGKAKKPPAPPSAEQPKGRKQKADTAAADSTKIETPKVDAKSNGTQLNGAQLNGAQLNSEQPAGAKGSKRRKAPVVGVSVESAPAEAATEKSPAARKGRQRPTKAQASASAESNRVVSLDEVRARVRSRGKQPKGEAKSEEASLDNDVASLDGAVADAAAADASEDAVSLDEAAAESSEQASDPAAAADGSTEELSEDEENLRYLRGLIEALLFSSDKPLTVRELARAARLDRARTQQLLDELVSESKQRGVMLIEIAGGWTMRSNPAYASYVQKMLALRPVRLSRAQLETLAIIAYRQPVTRPEVDDIRGVDSGQVIKGLLDRDLIKMLGKKDEAGRPMLYGTAAAFLELFSLESLSDLPSLKEFTELTQDSREYFESEIGETAPAGNLDDTNLDAPSRTLEDAANDETLEAPADLDSEAEAPPSEDAETAVDSDEPLETNWVSTLSADDPEVEAPSERSTSARREASAETARDDDDDDGADDDDAKDDEEE